MMRAWINKHIGKTILFRLVISFIFIIILTLFTSSFFTYSFFSSSFKSEITDVNYKLLNRVSMFSDEFILKNLNELTINLIMDKARYQEFATILTGSVENKTEILLNAQKKLSSIAFSNRDIVDSIFIHSRDNKIIVSSTFLKYYNENPESDQQDFNWISDFYKGNQSIAWLKTRNTKIYSDSFKSTGDIVTVICSYPLSSSGNDARGSISVNLKEEALCQYLAMPDSTNFGEIMIIDRDGSIIASSDKSSLYKDISREAFVKEILHSKKQDGFTSAYNNKEHVVSFVKSRYNNWYYVSLVPTSVFFQKDFIVKQRIIVISIIILVLVFTISNIFSLKIYKPFRKIIEKHIPSSAGGKLSENLNEYGLLDSMFDNMSSRINDLQQTLNKNCAMIRHNFLIDLINNRIKEAEYDNLLRLSNIVLTKSYFCVIVLTIGKAVNTAYSQDSLQFYKYSVIDYIHGLNETGYTHCSIDINSKITAVIINTEKQDVSIAKQFVDEAQAFCFSNFGFFLTIGVGRFVDDLKRVSDSYEDAMASLEYKFIHSDKNVFYYKEIAGIGSDEGSILPGFTEKLDKGLRLMNINDVKNTLDEYSVFIKGGTVSYRQARKTVSELHALFKKYLADINVTYNELLEESKREELDSPDNVNEFIGGLLHAVQKSFDFIVTRRSTRNAELIEKVKKYIICNLSQELSLNSAADEIHISPYYLSKMFKEETGENYIDFVTRCKIEKAKELLASNEFSIEEITGRIGYNHITYFTRKFKELTGKTPALYRSEVISG